MVLCDLYFKRFDLTKGLLFDTFSITVRYKLYCYDHSVLELESFFTTNELVRFKQKNYEKNAPQARFFCETKCAAGRIYQTKCAAGQNF